MGDPYRDAPERALVVRAKQPPRAVPWSALLAGASACVAVLVGAAGDVVFTAGAMVGIFSYLGITLLGGAAARRTFTKLPFPVEVVGDAGADAPKPIRQVEIWFADAVHGLDADAIAAAWGGAGLVAHLDGACLRLERWSWGDRDVAQLAALLEQLGREQHARHPIARVVVHCGSFVALTM